MIKLVLLTIKGSSSSSSSSSRFVGLVPEDRHLLEIEEEI